ncbi:MAG: hypothetical protein ACE5FN_11250 [Leptospirillia bacterium]
MYALTPDDIFGISIFGFFVLAVLVFVYITYKFFRNTGSKTKPGERRIVIGSVIGVFLVLIYAILAFIFKIII